MEVKKRKPIKKVSKHKKTVSPETYNYVYTRDKGVCRLCLRRDNTYDSKKDEWVHLEAHHILYRSERKDLINEPTNLIMLCNSCHKECHSNKKYWQPYLLELVNKE